MSKTGTLEHGGSAAEHLDEFSFISRFFAPLGGKGSFGLLDDGAVIETSPGMSLVVSTDNFIENVHFFSDDPARLIAQKLLRRNLSDLNAMGANPVGYLLNLVLPASPNLQETRFNRQWFEEFSRGLKEDQKKWGLTLLGGDTSVRPGPLAMAVTIFGEVPHGKALRRNSACAGDDLWITGNVGDAILGLKILQGSLNVNSADAKALKQAFRRPEPPLGLNLRGIAHAAIDVSDGLWQDAGHIARQSGVCLQIETDSLPFSQAVKKHWPEKMEQILTGGDLYQILFTASPDHRECIQNRALESGTKTTRIGQASVGNGVKILRQGAEIHPNLSGWTHF